MVDAASSKDIREKRILVVDDSAENLSMIEAILESADYQVSLAEDGIAALAQMKKLLPDLIISDVMMPKMNGNELTRQIRQQKNLPFIPILLITAQDKADVVEGLDAGADEFIRKPVDFDELLARVRSLLRLKQSIDEREKIGRLREDFVSRLTHDLRTPLVAAHRMLTFFEDGAFGSLSPEMLEAIATMKSSNQSLLEITNTMLEVYRYEAGCKKLTSINFDLSELITEVVRELRPLAEEKKIAFKFNLPSSEEVTINASRLEIRRVLTNMIGNAIKFTNSGSVKVNLQLLDKLVAIEIQDTGCGISEKEREQLFQRFRRGSHRLSGSGLGLHLTRQIVEAHQGKIIVKSELEKGSLFTVQLPITSERRKSKKKN